MRAFSDIQEQLLNAQITVTSIVQEYLNRINDAAHLNIYIEVFEEEALEKAQKKLNSDF